MNKSIPKLKRKSSTELVPSDTENKATHEKQQRWNCRVNIQDVTINPTAKEADTVWDKHSTARRSKDAAFLKQTCAFMWLSEETKQIKCQSIRMGDFHQITQAKPNFLNRIFPDGVIQMLLTEMACNQQIQRLKQNHLKEIKRIRKKKLLSVCVTGAAAADQLPWQQISCLRKPFAANPGPPIHTHTHAIVRVYSTG